jgi:hypothetical protein
VVNAVVCVLTLGQSHVLGGTGEGLEDALDGFLIALPGEGLPSVDKDFNRAFHHVGSPSGSARKRSRSSR